jgi:hypothetical protein
MTSQVCPLPAIVHMDKILGNPLQVYPGQRVKHFFQSLYGSFVVFRPKKDDERFNQCVHKSPVHLTYALVLRLANKKRIAPRAGTFAARIRTGLGK